MIHWLSTGIVTVLLFFFTLSTFRQRQDNQIMTQTSSAACFLIMLILNQLLSPVKQYKCLKHPYNSYTVLTCINHMLCICTCFFSISCCTFAFFITKSPSPNQRCDLPYCNFQKPGKEHHLTCCPYLAFLKEEYRKQICTVHSFSNSGDIYQQKMELGGSIL